jgi:hypothetical protein
MITRRNFIEMLGLTTAGALALNLSGKAFAQTHDANKLFSLPPESLSDPVLSFTSAHFTPFIDTDFQVKEAGAAQTETLRLLDVKEVPLKANLAKGVQGDSFSLLFDNTRAAKFDGNNFEFSHPSLGAFTLALMPVTAEPNLYEAVINHLRY